MIVISLPMVFGIIILSKDVYNIFYGTSLYGPNILIVSAIVNILWGTLSVINTSLQGFKKFKLVIINTLIGLVINAILDIPIILLLDKMNLTPYYGTLIATMIGTTTSITIALVYLKKKLNFKYMNILRNISKTFVPILAMSIVIFTINYFVGDASSRVISIIKVFLLAIIGALIYFAILYKNNGLYDIFGKEQINNIMRRLHLKKSH